MLRLHGEINIDAVYTCGAYMYEPPARLWWLISFRKYIVPSCGEGGGDYWLSILQKIKLKTILQRHFFSRSLNCSMLCCGNNLGLGYGVHTMNVFADVSVIEAVAGPYHMCTYACTTDHTLLWCMLAQSSSLHTCQLFLLLCSHQIWLQTYYLLAMTHHH